MCMNFTRLKILDAKTHMFLNIFWTIRHGEKYAKPKVGGGIDKSATLKKAYKIILERRERV